MLEERLDNGNFVVNSGSIPNAAVQNPGSDAAGDMSADVPAKPLEQALPEDLEQVALQWNSIVADIDASGALSEMLRKAKVTLASDNAGIEIMISSPSAYSFINRPEQIAQIEGAIEKRTGKHVNIKVGKIKEEQDLRNMFTDIRDMVKMEIEIDDNKEDLI